jgi:predicted TIM-barrel fold metal-dependent hydrolase
MTYSPTIPPPDPNTRAPQCRPPKLACDAHCHIFGPGSKYPYAADRSYAPPDAVETAVDRVIWGTDWPHPNVKVMPNDGDLVDLIPLFAPEVEFQHKILVSNRARRFGFEV